MREIKETVTFENEVLRVIFDRRNPNWLERESKDDHDYNVLYLKTQERFMNDLLMARNRLYVNDILEHMNFPRIQEGFSYGWLKEMGDYIKFDIQDMGDRIVVTIV